MFIISVKKFEMDLLTIQLKQHENKRILSCNINKAQDLRNSDKNSLKSLKTVKPIPDIFTPLTIRNGFLIKF